MQELLEPGSSARRVTGGGGRRGAGRRRRRGLRNDDNQRTIELIVHRLCTQYPRYASSISTTFYCRHLIIVGNRRWGNFLPLEGSQIIRVLCTNGGLLVEPTYISQDWGNRDLGPGWRLMLEHGTVGISVGSPTGSSHCLSTSSTLPCLRRTYDTMAAWTS